MADQVDVANTAPATSGASSILGGWWSEQKAGFSVWLADPTVKELNRISKSDVDNLDSLAQFQLLASQYSGLNTAVLRKEVAYRWTDGALAKSLHTILIPREMWSSTVNYKIGIPQIVHSENRQAVIQLLGEYCSPVSTVCMSRLFACLDCSPSTVRLSRLFALN